MPFMNFYAMTDEVLNLTLAQAASQGDTSTISAYLELGGDVNRLVSESGCTMLHLAAVNNNLHAVQLLLRFNADCDIESDEDKFISETFKNNGTALDCAIHVKNEPMILAIAAKENFYFSEHNAAPICSAAEAGLVDIVQWFYEVKGFNLSDIDECNDEHPLHAACVGLSLYHERPGMVDKYAAIINYFKEKDIVQYHGFLTLEDIEGNLPMQVIPGEYEYLLGDGMDVADN